ncbi:MAG: hypothetical protein IK062_01435 [Selenomonadaceae bacterium]|nr:hypothetical protein [Selenomonadaceae bacterium]
MDELKNFLELGEKIHIQLEKLQAENLKLQEDYQNILLERNTLLVELNNLLAENERLRKVNESFEKNLYKLPNQFQLIMRDELQKFFAGLSATAEKNFDEEETDVVPFESEIEILDAEEKLPDNISDNQQKKKMIYAEFYAEEAARD